MQKKGKLELTWVGKYEEKEIEPRILVENPALSYGDPNSENMLIHGDNLIALKALEQDYAGKIKCVYIDPPYNTGAAFEHYDDGIENSIWLSLMRERLSLLYELLSDIGVIFVSIDDHEVAYLQILMDEIFGRNNFISNLPTIMNLKGNQDQFGFAGTHEYTLVYAKDKNKVKLFDFPVDEEDLLKEWLEDEIGLYKKGATLKSTGEESMREDRPKMFYPILVRGNKTYPISITEYKTLYDNLNNIFNDEALNQIIEKYKNQGYDVVLPKNPNGTFGRWRWGYDTFISNYETETIVIEGREGKAIYKKQRPEIGEIPTKKPKSIFYKPEYSSGNGTSQIKKLFGYNSFSYPKPEDLIKDFLTIGSRKGDIILDSFLGSGTTAAVAHKMGRRWIGIELGEHAYTHCKIRMDKVVDGEQGGISKSINWQGGGGYKFYELAPSLLVPNPKIPAIKQINPEYTFEMVCEAICKLEGFKYKPNGIFHGKSSEKRYIHITKEFVNGDYINNLMLNLGEDQSLLIYGTKIQSGLKLPDNIVVKKIPKDLLEKCTFESEVR